MKEAIATTKRVMITCANQFGSSKKVNWPKREMSFLLKVICFLSLVLLEFNIILLLIDKIPMIFVGAKSYADSMKRA